ncbi:MAG: hypothetical protein QOG01_1377 [Pseudonocardiales bacterium]|jgi:hypothetical protein|nr:hypothetical protein [Pseudonocardiales bacterium]
MLGTTARLVLFVSSYAPLLVLFAVLDSFGPGWPSAVCWSVAGTSVLALFAVWTLASRTAPDWLRLSASRNRDADVMAYFVSYVVPFAAVDASTRTKIALGVFGVILAALYLRASIFYIHPLLLLAGYHVYDATTDAGIPVTVISRRRFLPQDDVVWAATISPSVHVERKAP